MDSPRPGAASVNPTVKPPRSVYAARLHEFPEIAFAEEAAFAHRGRWGNYFRERIGRPFDGRIIFEIGCFDAGFLCDIASRYPRSGFVGLDWKCKAVYDGARRITEQRLRNVAVLRGRGQDVRQIFADREVDEIWVFHPDPCAGKDELKNRLIAEPFLLDAHAVLRDGFSTLTLKTDHAGYYQWVLALFGLPAPLHFQANGETHRLPTRPKLRERDLMSPDDLPKQRAALLRRFTVVARSADFWNDAAAQQHVAPRWFSGARTLFEERFVKKKQPIYFFEIGKC